MYEGNEFTKLYGTIKTIVKINNIHNKTYNKINNLLIKNNTH